ncbi:uncharacterized protein GLRG_05001 [Colletotrichum graminicola M1.001]|uniref:DhaK domain-containing protein n=1 Tax=Colletotrichum graminicola (strain M1.001 / M2 / FGSC 10212) TaxID=645133 RepID=E3QG22_COLGM|nr:uncharacterized protein GLRG_05001 [Colletotrichum graminicola M1.001]EFQ29857.1 hypothetical protein GLRG_05001 [Colletotrichum graminicola M1.001]
MSAKHFINDPTKLVNSALHSLTLTNPSLALDMPNKIIYRRPSPDVAPQVSVVSGGGSGHEPSFSAMVGRGLLSAAVAGTIFASPSAEQVRTAIASRVDTTRGVLVTVMNYTGDVLNFGMAVEKARAAGLDVEMVVVKSVPDWKPYPPPVTVWRIGLDSENRSVLPLAHGGLLGIQTLSIPEVSGLLFRSISHYGPLCVVQLPKGLIG